MTRETGVNMVGLCHGPFGGIREITNVLGLDLDSVSFATPGVNHCVWMTEFRHEGRDAYPLIERWIDEEAEAYWRREPVRYSHTQLSPAAIHMYRFYWTLPLGDTSRAIWSEAWWYHQGLEGKQRWWGELGGFDVNVPNRGAISGIADDVVVECRPWSMAAASIPRSWAPCPRR